MANLLVKLRSLFLNVIFVSYIGISLLSLENCSNHKEDSSTADQLIGKKAGVVKLLLQEFDAEVFDCTIKKIFSKPVVLDTTLLGITRKNGEFFLSAQINASCVKEYFVRLRCSQEVIEQFNKTKSNNAIIAAKLTRMDKEQLIANADSLEGANPAIDLGETVIFSGECLAIREIPLEKDAD